MLGEQISDPHDLEGGDVDGLGILPITTELEPEKTLAQTTSTFGHLGGSWGSLSGVKVSGYEIRHGRSAPSGAIESALPDDRGWADGDTLAVYLHGLFENAGFLRAVLGVDPGADVEAAIDDLADAVAPHLDLDAILALTVA
jgi:adenosylcobyric acid synthase